jgi:hypothetical protein
MFDRLGDNDAVSRPESMSLILIGDSSGAEECDIFVERKK